MKKLEAAIRDAESAKSDEHASQREQIRINVLLEKLHREHSWQGIQRWEAHFYTKALHEAADDARQSLFELAKEALQEAIYWANKYPNNKDIERARKKAEKELKEPNTTHERINQVKDELISAIREEEKIHLSEDIRKELKSLEEAILVAEKYPESDGIKEALKEAKKVRDAVKEGDVSLETKKEISEVKDKLIRELAYALTPATFKDEEKLMSKISEATQLRPKAERAPIIKEMLGKAIKNGLQLLSDDEAKAIKYNFTKAMKQLDEAIEAVLNIPDLAIVERLEKLMEEAKEVIDGHDLSFASKAKLYEALSQANYVKDDHLATDEDYISAQRQLEAAISGAEAAKPDTPASETDKERLKEAIVAAEEMLKREGLSVEDGKILQEEIKKGQGVLKDASAKKVEVQRTTEAIYAAIDNARPANEAPATSLQKEELDRLLKEANGAKERIGISYEDLRRLEYAISMGEQVRKNPDSKFYDYEEAIDVLKDTLEKTKPMNPVEDPSKLATAEDKYLLEEKMRELSLQKMFVILEDRHRIDEILVDSRLLVESKQATKQDVTAQIAYIDRMMEKFNRLATKETIQELRKLVAKAKSQLGRLDPTEAQALKKEYELSSTLLKGLDDKKVEISQKQADERIHKLQVELTKTLKPASPEEVGELEELIDQLMKDKDLLSNEQQKELEKDLEKAKDVAEDPLATDADVDEAIKDLNKWKELAKIQSDKNKLKDQVEAARKLIEQNPEIDSGSLTQAINTANNTLNKTDADAGALGYAATNLEEKTQEFKERIAEKELADKAKENLSKEIENAKKLLQMNISKESKKKLSEEIEKAQKVYADKEADESSVSGAIEDLKHAMEVVEPLATIEDIAALQAVLDKSLAIQGDPSKVISEIQRKHLENVHDQAGQELGKREKLQVNIQRAKESLEEAIKNLVYLATDSDYNRLKVEIDRLQEIRNLYADGSGQAYDLQPVLDEANGVLQLKETLEGTTVEVVQEQINTLKQKQKEYENVLEELWKEEKDKLEKYIERMTHMLEGTVAKEGQAKFQWANETEDQPRVEEAKKSADELNIKANEPQTKVKLQELREENEAISQLLSEVDKMTEEDYVALKEKLENGVKIVYEDVEDVGSDEQKKIFNDLINDMEIELDKALGTGEGFMWNGMDRMKYLALWEEAEQTMIDFQTGKRK